MGIASVGSPGLPIIKRNHFSSHDIKQSQEKVNEVFIIEKVAAKIKLKMDIFIDIWSPRILAMSKKKLDYRKLSLMYFFIFYYLFSLLFYCLCNILFSYTMLVFVICFCLYSMMFICKDRQRMCSCLCNKWLYGINKKLKN